MNIKTLTVLLVSCCLVSGYFNVAWWGQRADLHSEKEGATAELAVEQKLFDDLQILTGTPGIAEEGIQVADKELVSLIVSVKRDLPDQMITLTNFSFARPSANAKGAAMSGLFMPINRTNGLKSVPVKITGRYRNLRLLQTYIRNLEKHPVVVSALNLDQDTFTLSLQLIGK